ncbi:MAG: N-acetylmuramoyl-L-alanine amidase [Acutalibacteraceae bacterium]|nr:N-acetylmuramoyl-L-alanine amidase [Acutalibacteraceae bacterium]
MIKIGLDAGHGLKTAGKQTPDGIKEWTLNDKVRDKVVSLLSSYDCELILTDNDEGNTDESLTSRVNKYITAGVDAFVSIHHNAFTGAWSNATGVEVYVDKNATDRDMRLAELIYTRLYKNIGLKGRGIKKANFQVINQNSIPAVLVEGGFMDGTNDYNVITSEAGQTAYAKAVAEGLIEFLGLKEKKAKENTVLLWQKAAITDGFRFEKYGADGIWGSECETVAKKILIKNGSKYKNLNMFFQNLLYKKGYDMSSSLKKDGTFDGIWGNGSVNALKSFQEDNNLSKDGILGIKTCKKLLEV